MTSTCKFFCWPLLAGVLLVTGSMGRGLAAEPLYLVGDLWPPYVEHGNPARGLAAELVTTALQRAGYDVEFTLERRSRVVEGARIGVFDVVVAVWPEAGMQQVLQLSKPYLFNDIRFIRKKNSKIEYRQLDDLEGLMIGVVRGFYYDSGFMTSRNLIRIEQNFMTQTLNSLVKGDVDLAMGDERALRYHLHAYFQHANHELVIMDQPLAKPGLSIGVSRAHPRREEILQRFELAIQEMQQDGSYQSLLNNYSSFE